MRGIVREWRLAWGERNAGDVRVRRSARGFLLVTVGFTVTLLLGIGTLAVALSGALR